MAVLSQSSLGAILDKSKVTRVEKQESGPKKKKWWLLSSVRVAKSEQLVASMHTEKDLDTKVKQLELYPTLPFSASYNLRLS